MFRWLNRALGIWLTVVLALGLLAWLDARLAPALIAPLIAAALLAFSLAGYRRWRAQKSERHGQLVFALQALVAALALAHGRLLPSSLQFGLFYWVMCAALGFAEKRTAVSALLFGISLDAACTWLRAELFSAWLWRSALVCAFGLLIFGVRRSQQRLAERSAQLFWSEELEKLKEAARSYRLTSAHAPGTRSSHSEVSKLWSGIDQIDETLRYTLRLLERALGLKTVLCLGLDENGEQLSLRAWASSAKLKPGPFPASSGVFGAVLSQRQALQLKSPKGGTHLPYYDADQEVGAAYALPLFEGEKLGGLLVVDRLHSAQFSAEERQILANSAAFIVRTIENERVFMELERAKNEQTRLYRAANALSRATTEKEVIEAGVTCARQFTRFDWALVTLYDAERNEHEIMAVSGDGARELVGEKFRHNAGLVSMVVENRHALPLKGDYDPARQVVFNRRLLLPEALASLVVLPLCVHESALGTLILGSKQAGTFGEAVRPTLEVLASHIAVSLAHARMVHRLEELATRDGLTGTYNKRAMLDLGVQKLKSAARFKKPVTLLVCDLDHFKRVNDTHGHDVGDAVIKGFAAILQRAKRDTDLVARFGGEEFVVLCEETATGGATQLAERIRADLENTAIGTSAGPIHVTCSIGLASFPSQAQDWDALFRAADEALYASKRAGRNRVTVFDARQHSSAAE